MSHLRDIQYSYCNYLVFHLNYNSTNTVDAVDQFFPYVAWTISYQVVEDEGVDKVEPRSTIATQKVNVLCLLLQLKFSDVQYDYISKDVCIMITTIY